MITNYVVRIHNKWGKHGALLATAYLVYNPVFSACGNLRSENILEIHYDALIAMQTAREDGLAVYPIIVVVQRDQTLIGNLDKYFDSLAEHFHNQSDRCPECGYVNCDNSAH